VIDDNHFQRTPAWREFQSELFLQCGEYRRPPKVGRGPGQMGYFDHFAPFRSDLFLSQQASPLAAPP
jgi:hypothetical protein